MLACWPVKNKEVASLATPPPSVSNGRDSALEGRDELPSGHSFCPVVVGRKDHARGHVLLEGTDIEVA